MGNHSVHPLLSLGGSYNFGILGFRRRPKYFWFQTGVVLWGWGEGGGEYISSIHIFRFKTDAGLQVDTDFNTESKFSFSSSSFFSLLVGTQNQPNPWNCFLLHSFAGLQSSQSISCEFKQTWQLLVKTKSYTVNKQPSVQHEGEFWERERWLAVSDKSLY